MESRLFWEREGGREGGRDKDGRWSRFSLDVWLVERCECGMYGDGDGRQVEVVEEHRQVVVEAAGRVKLQVERAGGHALDGAGMLLDLDKACRGRERKVISRETTHSEFPTAATKFRSVSMSSKKLNTLVCLK